MINTGDLAQLAVLLSMLNVPTGGGTGGSVTQQEVQRFAFNYAPSTGADDAFVVTLNPVVTSLTNGLLVTMASGALQNLTQTPTLQVNGLPAVPIVLWAGAVAPGDIQPNAVYLFVYNAASNQFQLINPSITTADTFLLQSNAYNTTVDVGAPDAYVGTITPESLATVPLGFPIYMQIGAGNTNTGDSTLSINSELQSIKLNDGSSLSAGMLVEGQIYWFLQNPSIDAWVLMNPTVASVETVPAGTIISFAGVSAPTGYLVCGGAAVSRATYSVLFAAISTTWGVGDGSTTFNLPNFSRRTPVGSGGTGTGTLGNAVGNIGGAETVTLTTTQMPSHNHTPLGNGAFSELLTPGNTSLNYGGGNNVFNSSVTGSTGSGGAHNNIQPSAVVLMCIKF